MLIPSKHEKLDRNLLVIGGLILEFLKKKKSWNLEVLFQKIQKKQSINLDQYYNSLTFLWIAGILDINHIFVSKIE